MIKTNWWHERAQLKPEMNKKMKYYESHIKNSEYRMKNTEMSGKNMKTNKMMFSQGNVYMKDFPEISIVEKVNITDR